MVRRAVREIRETDLVVAVHEPSESFDWGDAGIGAAGMLALFGIAAGSALMLTEAQAPPRRQGRDTDPRPV